MIIKLLFTKMAKTQNQSKSLSDLKESDNKAVILSKAGDLKVGVWPLEKQLGPKGESTEITNSLSEADFLFTDCLLESKRYSIMIGQNHLHLHEMVPLVTAFAALTFTSGRPAKWLSSN